MLPQIKEESWERSVPVLSALVEALEEYEAEAGSKKGVVGFFVPILYEAGIHPLSVSVILTQIFKDNRIKPTSLPFCTFGKTPRDNIVRSSSSVF